MRWKRLARVAAAAALLASSLAASAAVTVGSGSSLSLGSGSLDLGEHDLGVAGSLAAGTGLVDRVRDLTIQPGGVLNGESAAIQVCGDWSNAGTFTAGTSLVRFLDGCGRSSTAFTGNTTFFNLTLTSGFGRLFSFAAGSTTTVGNFLSVQGASGSLLQVRSSVPGSEAFLDLQGGSSAEFVDVEDNHAIGTPIVVANGTLGANAPGWSGATLVPSLGPVGLGVLALGLLWIGRRRLTPGA
jgi:hypothetical protein